MRYGKNAGVGSRKLEPILGGVGSQTWSLRSPDYNTRLLPGINSQNLIKVGIKPCKNYGQLIKQ